MLLLLPSLLCAVPAAAQQWMADVYVGGTRYDPLASFVGAANVVGNVRMQTARAFAYLSGAAPLDADAPLWGALGAGLRMRRSLPHGARAGLDLGADGYVFRHDADVTGSGATTQVLPLVAVTRGAFDVQLSGGRRDHHSDDGIAGRYSRHMYEAGVRGTVSAGTHVTAAEVRVLAADGATYPMAQLQFATLMGPVQLWGSTGHWFGDQLNVFVWGAGASADVGSRGQLWAGVRRDAEPLYQVPDRTSWNVGYTMRLGRTQRSIPAPARRDGSIIVRLPRSADTAPAVAGEFSDWQPLPMRAAGDEWLVEIPAAPGVYRFAFVGGDGRWFVPEGYPGRMDDDMGGHVAVVVVQ